MMHLLMQAASSLPILLLALFCASCQDGKRFYPVRGQVFTNGKPAAGVRIVFHPHDDPDPNGVRPSATVQSDGSFALRTYLLKDRTLKDGAPAGQYHVSCVWYPADLEKYAQADTLPDRLLGRYMNPKTSGLRAEVLDQATDLPAFQLDVGKR